MKTLTILATAILLAFSYSPVTAQFSLQDSLVAYYPMNGSAQDMSGNGNHGTVSGASLTTDRFGVPNEAYAFDGTNDVITFLDNQNLHPDLPVTISVWVKLSGSPQKQPIFKNDWLEDYYTGVWLVIPANGRISAAIGDGDLVSPGSRRTKEGVTSLTYNTWHHVVAVIRGPQDMSLYLDGREDCGNYSGSGGPLSYSEGPGKGGLFDSFSQPGALNYFQGSMDELRLYSRALSTSEVEQLAGAAPTAVSDTVCVGDTVSLAAPGGYQSYSWLNASALSCANCQVPTVISDSVGTFSYEAIITNASGCADTFSVSLEVEQCCLVPVSGIVLESGPIICPNDSFGSLTLTGVGGVWPYQYSLNGSGFANSGVFAQLPPGSHDFTIRDSAGCEYDTTVLISPPPPPISIQSMKSDPSALGANDGTAKAIPSGGNGSPWSFFWSTGAMTDSIGSLSPGTYVVTATDSKGCFASDTVVIADVACQTGLKGLVMEKVEENCPGDSVGSFVMVGTGGFAPYQFALNGGAYSSSGVFSNLPSGAHNISILDSAGCEIDTVVQIAYPPSPIILQISSTNQTTYGVNDGTAMVVPSGGNGAPWSYYWSNGTLTDSAFQLAPGIYTVTVTDSLGCSEIDTVEIQAANRVGITQFPASYSWHVLPNPASTFVEVVWDFPGIQEVSIQVTDIRGRRFHQSTGLPSTGNLVLETNDAMGIYLVEISDGKSREYVRLVIR